MDKTVLLNLDGTQQEVKPKNGTDFTLKELYTLLDCEMIQVFPANQKGMILIMDEEGKFKWSAQVNHQATKLAQDNLLPGDVVVGKVLYCSEEMFK